MKIDLHHMITLEAIVRLGSFQAAADELHKAKSAISYTVKQMEEALAIEIFDRSKQRAELTAAGTILLAESKKLINHSKRLEEKLAILASGWESVFRIAYDESLQYTLVYPMLSQFYQDCRHTNLDMTSHTLGGCWDALLAKEVDCAIGVSGVITQREEYIFVPLGELKFEFVVSVAHPLASLSDPLTKEQIDPYLAIFVSDSSNSPCQQTYDVLTNARMLISNSVVVKAELIAAGLGVGFLPTTFIQQGSWRDKLVVKSVVMQRPSAQMSLAFHQNRAGSRVVQWIQRFLAS